ncbi:MAG: hypothetical protein ACYCZR_08065 [Burkholderiales bacterium]
MNYVHFSGELAANPVLLGQWDISFTLTQKYLADGKKLDIKELAVEFFASGQVAEGIAKRCLKGDQLIVTARIEGSGSDGFIFVLQDFQLGVMSGPRISDSGKVLGNGEAS